MGDLGAVAEFDIRVRAQVVDPDGVLGAPPWEPTRRSCRPTRMSGVLRMAPVLLPALVTMMTGRPVRGRVVPPCRRSVRTARPAWDPPDGAGMYSGMGFLEGCVPASGRAGWAAAAGARARGERRGRRLTGLTRQWRAHAHVPFAATATVFARAVVFVAHPGFEHGEEPRHERLRTDSPGFGAEAAIGP
jgi:hypothetical protein